MKKNRGLIVAATFIAFSIYIFVASSTITSTSGAALGPAFMPRVIALSLFVLGILNFLEEWKARKALLKEEHQPSCEEPQPVVTDKKEKLRAFIAKYIDYISGVLILLYAFSVKPLGFLLASCL